MLDVKKVEHLYKNSFLSYAGSAFGALLVFWLFQDTAPDQALKIWFGLFIILTVIRFVLSYIFQRAKHNDNIDTWLLLFLVLSFISGVFWGLTGFLFVPAADFALHESVIYHGMLLLFIAALIAASVITYSISKLVFVSFALPAVVPQSLFLIAKGDIYHSFLGGFMLAYAMVIFVISIYMCRLLTATLQIQDENELLKGVIRKAGIKINSDRITQGNG